LDNEHGSGKGIDMSKKVFIKGLLLIPAVLLLLSAFNFLVQPQQAVESLGMMLLDGIGRSSQIGDMGAFFVCTAGFIFYGVAKSVPGPIYASAALLVTAAMYRTVAWLYHDADFASSFIIFEIVLFAWLVVLARLMAAPDETSTD
jgi:hypothetical protein